MTTIHTSYATYYNCYSKKFVAANREHYPKATPDFERFEKHNEILLSQKQCYFDDSNERNSFVRTYIIKFLFQKL